MAMCGGWRGIPNAGPEGGIVVEMSVYVVEASLLVAPPAAVPVWNREKNRPHPGGVLYLVLGGHVMSYTVQAGR